MVCVSALPLGLEPPTILVSIDLLLAPRGTIGNACRDLANEKFSSDPYSSLSGKTPVAIRDNTYAGKSLPFPDKRSLRARHLSCPYSRPLVTPRSGRQHPGQSDICSHAVCKKLVADNPRRFRSNDTSCQGTTRARRCCTVWYPLPDERYRLLFPDIQQQEDRAHTLFCLSSVHILAPRQCFQKTKLVRSSPT